MTREQNTKNLPWQQSRRKRLVFHALAFVVVLSPLVVGELLVRLCVPKAPARPDDPYVTFRDRNRLFVLDATGTRYETATDRLAAFRSQSFAAEKSARTFRIFCLGGSTVQGRPYSVETSFTTWLRLDLEAAQPETNWEVVNVGGISYASYRLVPILRELLAYHPDLFILYTGHNEFLEDRTYGDVKDVPGVLVRLHRAALHLRSYALADAWLAQRRRRRTQTVLPSQVQTKLDLAAGLDGYRRDPLWRQNVITHFGHNLQTMVRVAREAGVPMILVNPVANLKDCPPFKSEFRAGLSETDRAQIVSLMEQAGALAWMEVYRKITLLERAVALDDQHATLAYLLGTCYARAGRTAKARTWFMRAKEQDTCPLRMLEPMHAILRDIAEREDVGWVDARALLEAQTADGMVGKDWMLDHVHPRISGHQLIADALYRTMAKMGWVQQPADWAAQRDRRWQEHLASLNEAYYAQGAARLKRLEEWSRGRIHQK